MIIDSRAGSNELYLPLKALGVPAELGNLPAGDVEFIGNGHDGPAVVLVEYKKLGDLFQCMRDGRFADQLRKMKEAGTHSWLLIEGQLRNTERGRSMQAMGSKGRWRTTDGHISYQEMVGWIMTMSAVAGVHVWRTSNQGESVDWVRGMYNWWTAKEWEQHRAHLDFYKPPIVQASFAPPTLVQKVAAVLPGIGNKKAATVAKFFSSVRKMISATPEEWQEIEGIGKKGSETIVEAVK